MPGIWEIRMFRLEIGVFSRGEMMHFWQKRANCITDLVIFW